MSSNVKKYFNIKKLSAVLLGSFITAASINYFIEPVGLYTGGLMGLILIIGTLTNGVISFGVLNLLFNIPLLFLSWYKLGKRFTFYTMIGVIAVSFFAETLPVLEPISDDKLIMSLFGGVATGFGVYFMLQAGGSGGGSDIISLYFSEKTGKPLGVFAFIFNIIVLSLTALLFDVEIVMYTLIGSYATSVVIDKFHTRYQKLTLTINTSNAEALIEDIQNKSTRGVTIIPAIGGYTRQERQLLYVVISSFELSYMLDLIKNNDEHAFVNVTKSIKVLGNFKVPSIDEI